MKWICHLGIFILFCKVVNATQPDCTVDSDYREKHWNGNEVKFYAYVLQNDAVNIKITYMNIDITEFFTTFYFSPSPEYSRRIETVNGKDFIFDLTTMEKATDWFEFRISSETGTGTIEYLCEPNIHNVIQINQTSHTFNELIITASHVSLCEKEKDWVVLDGKNRTIPLGRDSNKKSFTLKFYPHRKVKPVIRILNSKIDLIPYNDYKLLITKTSVTLKSLKVKQSDITIDVDDLITSIDIISESGRFTTTVIFETKSPSSPTVIPEADCPTCYNIICIVSLVLLIVVSFLVVLLIKFNIFGLRIQLAKLLDKKEVSNATNRNNGNNGQNSSLNASDSEEDSV